MIEAGGNLFSPDGDGSTPSTAETDRAAQNQRGQDGNRKTGLELNLFQRPQIDAEAVRGKGRSTTGGGQAARLRQQQNRSSKKDARLSPLLATLRRSNFLNAVANAARAMGKRQIRVMEYRLRARLNPFANWGGASMRIYRQQRSAIRRVDFAARVSRNFWRDLHSPKL